MDHDWPSDLDGDAKCYACGLSYDQWDEETTLWCPGER